MTLVTRLKRTAQLTATVKRRYELLHVARCPACGPGRPGCEDGRLQAAYVQGMELALAMLKGDREWRSVAREP